MQGKIGVTKKLDVKFESKIKLEEFLDLGCSFDLFLLQCTFFLNICIALEYLKQLDFIFPTWVEALSTLITF
jgi:hypothetical protein